MTVSRTLTAALAGLTLTACGGSGTNDLDEAAKTRIDCLASKTVVLIADTIRGGIADGVQPDQLSDVQAEKIADGVAIVETARIGEGASNYFEFETVRRLNAMQNAIRSGDQDSDDRRTMIETQAIAETCSF